MRKRIPPTDFQSLSGVFFVFRGIFLAAGAFLYLRLEFFYDLRFADGGDRDILHTVPLRQVEHDVLFHRALGFDRERDFPALQGHEDIGRAVMGFQARKRDPFAFREPFGDDTRADMDLFFLKPECVHHVLTHGKRRPEVVQVTRFARGFLLAAAFLAVRHEGRRMVERGIEIFSRFLIKSEAQIGARDTAERHCDPKSVSLPARSQGQAALAESFAFDIGDRAADHRLVCTDKTRGEKREHTAVDRACGRIGRGRHHEAALDLHEVRVQGVEECLFSLLAKRGQHGDVLCFAEDLRRLQRLSVGGDRHRVQRIVNAVIVRAVHQSAVAHAARHKSALRHGSRVPRSAARLTVEDRGGKHSPIILLQKILVARDVIMLQNGIRLIVDTSPDLVLPALRADPTAVRVLAFKVKRIIRLRLRRIAERVKKDLRFKRLAAVGGAIKARSADHARIFPDPLSHNEKVGKARAVAMKHGGIGNIEASASFQEGFPLRNRLGNLSFEVKRPERVKLAEIIFVGHEEITRLALPFFQPIVCGDLLHRVRRHAELQIVHRRQMVKFLRALAVEGIIVRTVRKRKHAVNPAVIHREQEVFVHAVDPALIADDPAVRVGELDLHVVGLLLFARHGRFHDYARLRGDRLHAKGNAARASLGKKAGRAAFVAVPFLKRSRRAADGNIRIKRHVHRVRCPRKRIIVLRRAVRPREFDARLRQIGNEFFARGGAAKRDGVGCCECVIK